MSESVCAACKVAVKKYVSCYKCNMDYHANCVVKIPGIYVDSDGLLFCCDSLEKRIVHEVKREMAANSSAMQNSINKLQSMMSDIQQALKGVSGNGIPNVISTGAIPKASRPSMKLTVPAGFDEVEAASGIPSRSNNSLRMGTAPAPRKVSAGRASDTSRPVPAQLSVPPEAASPPQREDETSAVGWATVVRRNRRRARNIIVGTSTTDSASKIKAAKRIHHHHVFNFEPNTTCEDVITFLKNSGLNDVECVALNSRNPKLYASFRISAPENCDKQIAEPSFWPSGVHVKRYYFPRDIHNAAGSAAEPREARGTKPRD